MTRLKLDVLDERIVDLLRWVGTRYCWGAGAPKDALDHWPPNDPPKGVTAGTGVDCSGLVQICLVRLGILQATAPDRTAAALWDMAKPVPIEDARLGDLAFYGQPSHIRHVTLCLGGGLVMGANGGGSNTNGDCPSAFVKLDRIAYRSDFRGVRRLVP